MNLSYLTRSFDRAAQSAGYEFASATKEYLPTQIASFPAVFLLTPSCCSVEGRNSGKLTYRITLHLMSKGAKRAPANRDTLLDRLETDALTIFASIAACHRILAVENLTLTPAALPLTARGDVSMTVTADVVTEF